MSDRVLSGKRKDGSRCLYDCFESYNEKNTKRLFPNWLYADNLLKTYGAYLLSRSKESVMNRVIMWLPVQLVLAYFAASPRHDSGYDEMTLSQVHWMHILPKKQLRCGPMAKQRQAEQEAAEQAQKRLHRSSRLPFRPGRPSSAGCRRGCCQTEGSADAFAAAYAANTKDAYMHHLCLSLMASSVRMQRERRWQSNGRPKRQLKKNLYELCWCQRQICSYRLNMPLCLWVCWGPWACGAVMASMGLLWCRWKSGIPLCL